jgi:hypothetical protein
VLASASADSTGKIWEVATGRRLDTLNQPQGEQFRIDFTPDGRFLVGVGADNRIRLWRFLSKTAPRINPVVHARFGHEDAIVSMAISDDGKTLVTTSADRALKRWSLPALRLAGVHEVQSDVVSAIAFVPGGGEIVAARLDGTIDTLAPPVAPSSDSAGSATIARSDPKSGDSGAPASEKPQAEPLDENEGAEAPELALGTVVKGAIGSAGDEDVFPFQARAGETWIFETNAARSKSKLDSHLSVLDGTGKPVERAVLQAMRDSWITFRGKDSATSADFRLHNWREMELNEFLYVNGEVSTITSRRPRWPIPSDSLVTLSGPFRPARPRARTGCRYTVSTTRTTTRRRGRWARIRSSLSSLRQTVVTRSGCGTSGAREGRNSPTP